MAYDPNDPYAEEDAAASAAEALQAQRQRFMDDQAEADADRELEQHRQALLDQQRQLFPEQPVEGAIGAGAPAPLPPGAGDMEPAAPATARPLPQVEAPLQPGKPAPLPEFGKTISTIPEEPQKPPAELTYGQEIGRGIARAVGGTVLKAGEEAARIINYAQRQFGLDTSNTEQAIKDYKETIPQFEKDYGPGYATALDAWQQSGFNATVKHAVGSLVEGAVELAPALKAGKIGQALYFGVLGGIHAADNTDGDLGATMYGVATGAAAGMAQLGLLTKPLPLSVVGNIATRILGLGAVGEAQTLGQPLEKVIAGQGSYQTPTTGQLVEPAVGALLGFFGRNKRAPETRPPPVDADKAAALAETLPGPPQGPPGPGPGGAPSGFPLGDQSQVNPRPPPPPLPEPIVPDGPGGTPPPDVPPPVPPTPPPPPRGGPGGEPLAPEPQIPREGPPPPPPVEPPGPGGTPLEEPRQPPPAPPGGPGGTPLPEEPRPAPVPERPAEPPTGPTPPGVGGAPLGEEPRPAPVADRYARPWTQEPDDVTPGQVVTKNTRGDVIGVGDTAEQSMRVAEMRAQEAADVSRETTTAVETLPKVTTGSSEAPPAAEARATAEPATVGAALAEAKATGEKPATVVEKVKRRKVEEPTEPVEPAAPKTSGTLSLLKRDDLAARIAERKAQLEAARRRPAQPPEPEVEPPAAPLKRTAEPKGEAPQRETFGDLRGVPRDEQSRAELLSARTTSKAEIGRALMDDLTDPNSSMTLKKAAELYGEQPAGAGRRRAANDLHDFAVQHVKDVETGGAANQAKIERLGQQHAAEREVVRKRSAQTSSKLQRIEGQIANEIKQGERFTKLERLREVRDQLREHLGKQPDEAVQRGVSKLQELARKIGGDEPLRQRGRRDVAADVRHGVVDRPLRDRLMTSQVDNVSHSLHDYLNDIINHTPARALAPHLVEFARQIQRILPGDIRVMSHDTAYRLTGDPVFLGLKRDEVPGGYSPDHNIISLDPARYTVGLTETLLHEAGHKAASRYIERIDTKLRNGEALTAEEAKHRGAVDAIMRELEAVRDNPHREFSQGEREALDYALSNRVGHEFVSQAFTDPDLQTLLADRTASPQLRAELRRLGFEPDRTTTLWTALKDTVASIFGRGNRSDSVLDQIMRPTHDILERGAAYERGFDLTGSEPLRARGRRTGEVPTDDIPDERLRNAVRPVGELHRDTVTPDVVSGGWTDLLNKATSNIRLPFAAARGLAEVSPSEQIAKWHERVLPELKGINEARKDIADASKQFLRKYGNQVHDLIDRLRGQDDVGKLTRDVGEFTGGRAARLGGENFEADNAHLNKPGEIERAREMQQRFDALTPEQQQTYRDLRTHYAQVDRDEKAALFTRIAAKALPEWSPAERSSLEDQLKTRSGINQMLRNPDASPVAEAMGERFQHSRAVVQEIARAWSAGHITGDYFPLRRFGDWIVSYGDKGTDSYGVEMFDRKGEAEARRRQLQLQGTTDVDLVRHKAQFNRADAVPERAFDLLDDALRGYDTLTAQQRGEVAAGNLGNLTERQRATIENRRSTLTEEQIKEVKDIFTGLALRNATNSARARTLPRRQGVAGASIDAVRILSSDTTATASRMGHFLHGAQEQEAIRTAERELRARAREAPGRAVSQEQLYRAQIALDELKARGAPLDGDLSSGITGTAGRLFTRASYVYQLMRPAKLVLDLVDNNARASAILGGRYGVGRGSVALTKALLDVAPQAWRSGFQNMARAMQGELRAADWDMAKVMRDRLVRTGMKEDHADALIAEMDRAGYLSNTMTLELRRLSQAGGFDTTSAGGRLTQAGRIGSNMMDLFAAAEHSVDIMSRTATGKAAFDLELQRGADVAGAARAAVEVLRDSSPNVATWNLPRIATARGRFGQAGAALTQYRVFGMQMYAMMANLAKTTFEPGRSSAERVAAGKSLGLLLGINSLLVGATANVFGSFVLGGLGAYDYFSGRDRPHDYEKDMDRYVTSIAGPRAGTLLRTGLMGQLGIDARRNLGFGNMAGIPEIKAFDQTSYAAFMSAVLGGASGGLGQQIAVAGHDILTGNYARGATGLMPRILRDPTRAYLNATQGLTDPRGSVIKRPETVSPLTTAYTALGINPVENSNFYEGRRAIVERRNEANDAAKHATEVFVRSGGRDRSALDAYNREASRPGAIHGPLPYSQVLQTLQRERKQSQDASHYGLQISKKQERYLLPAARF